MKINGNPFHKTGQSTKQIKMEVFNKKFKEDLFD